MTYHGHVENGHIVLDESVKLPEGAVVKVDVLGSTHVIENSWRERLDDLRRKVSALKVENPNDGWSNRDHDTLLYGEQT